jgi:hypothetical protein
LEGADTFVFSQGRICAFNDHVTVSAPQPSSITDALVGGTALEGAVKAEEFLKLLSKLKGEVIKIVPTDNGNAWSIRSGNAKAEYALIPSQIGDRVKSTGILEDTDWHPLPADFWEGLRACAIAKNNSALSGIYVGDDFVFSTDELRINAWKLSEEMHGTFWIAAGAAAQLEKFGGELAEYRLTKAWAHFRTKGDVRFSAKRLAEERYPAGALRNTLNAMLEKKDDDLVGAIPSELSEAIERASALSMDMEAFKAVQLTITPAGIEVFAKRSAGKYEELVEWPADGHGRPADIFDPVVVHVDPGMIAYGIDRSPNFFTRNMSPAGTASPLYRLVFTGERVTHILSTFAVRGESAE